MSLDIGKSLEVYSLEELPRIKEQLKFFACIGGNRNYQCFLESKQLSRAEFMNIYQARLDPCHVPIYEDNDIVIRQDAFIPIPGFYIIATKNVYKKISYMEMSIYQKCLRYSSLVKSSLESEFGINRVYMYYDEHYNKPSSTHFWVMPIHEEIIHKNNLNPTILNYDIWKYQELFEFQYYRDNIYEVNDVMKKVLKR